MVMFLNYPSWISPYVIKGLPIRWYAVMYIFAFMTAYYFYNKSVKQDLELKDKRELTDDFFFVVVLSLLLGARIGSCLFYDDALYYLKHPYLIFWPFRNGQFVGLPGMSYHGGVIGALIGGTIYIRIKRLKFWKMTDYIALSVPFAYTWGRIGNFLNGELYGRVSTSPIAMIFPDAEYFNTSIEWVREVANKVGLTFKEGELINLPRWPSQLFEAFFEGIVLGLVIYFIIKPLKERGKVKDGTIFSSYLIGYGLIRFVLEYFRQPDSDIGYVLSLGKKSTNIYLFEGLGTISKGQVFCFTMIVIGIIFLVVCNYLGNKEKANDKRKSR